MGKWAENEFGQSKFSDVGIVIAGINSPEFQSKILSKFDKIIFSKDCAYHTYIAKKNGKFYPVVFNVYGAPAMVDVLAEMHDGGCRNVLFVGYAYGGFKNLNVGSIIIPNKSYHFEGIYHHIEPDRHAGFPDKELKEQLERILNKNKINYANGINISVPSVTFQLPHNNPEYKKINPDTVEMEFASCLSRAKDLGIRAAGALIISDNKGSSIGDKTKREIRHKAKINILNLLIKNIEKFSLPKLKVKKEFSIDEHLASIIEDPEDKTNIYRNKNR
jgi:purine-nucleoside phosphorylase